MHAWTQSRPVAYPPTGWPSLKPPPSGRCRYAGATRSSRRTSPCSTTRDSGRSIRCSSTGNGAKQTFRSGWAMPAFEYRQAEEVRDAFARYGVRYLFLGKSGAILLGYPDTTQDADVFVERSPENGDAVVRALTDLGFDFRAYLRSKGR